MVTWQDLIFPRRCLGCGLWGQYFCPKCLKKVKFLENQICPYCLKSDIYGRTHPRCLRKSKLDGLISIFKYQGIVKNALSKLKYRYVFDLAGELVSKVVQPALQKEFSNYPVFLKSIILLPVPLHSRKKRQRGFNQAELIGKILADQLGWQFENQLIIRRHYTRPQTKLKKEERKENVEGAFGINPKSSFQAKKLTSHCILFDDVWTTGSTLKECGLVLKKAGWKNIWGLTLAK